MKLALIGYGKMGHTIESVLADQATGEDSILFRFTHQNREELTEHNLKKADVAIEFTQPQAAVENIYTCFRAGVPVVVGTTAWLDRWEEVIHECNKLGGTLFYSPNFSIGVHLFWEVNRCLARMMKQQPQYQVSIEEIHHTEKKDAPSGTAIKTAQLICEQIPELRGWALQTDATPVENHKLPITAKRLPEVPGTHIVRYLSTVDGIELKHEAKNRRGFAEGALMAARWVIGKKGVFEMKDMLGL